MFAAFGQCFIFVEAVGCHRTISIWSGTVVHLGSYLLPARLPACLSVRLPSLPVCPAASNTAFTWPGLAFPGGKPYLHFPFSHSLHSSSSSPFSPSHLLSLIHSLLSSLVSSFTLLLRPPASLIPIVILRYDTVTTTSTVPVSYCVQSVDLISQRI